MVNIVQLERSPHYLEVGQSFTCVACVDAFFGLGKKAQNLGRLVLKLEEYEIYSYSVEVVA